MQREREREREKKNPPVLAHCDFPVCAFSCCAAHCVRRSSGEPRLLGLIVLLHVSVLYERCRRPPAALWPRDFSFTRASVQYRQWWRISPRMAELSQWAPTRRTRVGIVRTFPVRRPEIPINAPIQRQLISSIRIRSHTKKKNTSVLS